MAPEYQFPLWVPPADMLTQHKKRMLTARSDKPQYPDKFRKLTMIRAIPVRPDAEVFIKMYEYLGGLGTATRAAYGLFTPWGELLGVECFGATPGDRLGKRLCADDPSRVPRTWGVRAVGSALLGRAADQVRDRASTP